jgi:hypothetical protein
VSGFFRSGTTWFQECIAEGACGKTVFEPLSPYNRRVRLDEGAIGRHRRRNVEPIREDVKSMPAPGKLVDEAPCDEPVPVKRVIGQVVRAVDDENVPFHVVRGEADHVRWPRG